MIVLNTDVVLAFMEREIDPAVVAWLDSQPAQSIWTTSITVFAVRMGLELHAIGRRRALEDAFEKALEEDFEQRVLPFVASPRNAAAPDVRSTSAMSRLPASLRPERRRSRRAMRGISRGSDFR